jgi:hypothetical protein
VSEDLSKGFVVALFLFSATASFTEFYPNFWLSALVIYGVIHLDVHGGR